MTDNETKRAIAYVRVSSRNQGKSGIGLEGQKQAIKAYADTNGFSIDTWLEEVESARGSDSLANRPILGNALERARKDGIPIIVSDADRFSRHKEIFRTIVNDGVHVILAERGLELNSSNFEAHAARAEHDGHEISRRTKEGLERKRAAGKTLGNMKSLPVAQKLGAARNREIANAKVREIDDFIAKRPELQNASGPKVAHALNDAGILTTAGNSWSAQNIKRPLRKLRTKPSETNKVDVEIPEPYRDDPTWGIF